MIRGDIICPTPIEVDLCVAYRVGMVTGSPPTLARRTIGNILSQLRKDANKTQSEAADYVGKTEETIRRWERGKSPVNVSHLRDLCTLYGAPSTTLSRLTSLSRDSKTPGLFEAPHVTPDNRALWENELNAALLRSLELVTVPGLLQTPDYQHQVQQSMLPAAREVQTANRQNRQARQEKVHGQPTPPRMQFVIGRSAIDYMDTAPVVKDGQINRLRELNAMDHVEIRVLATFHASMLSSFYMVTPRASSLDARPFVYFETAHGGMYEESNTVFSLYGSIFSAAYDSAIALEEYLK